jgi:hypothetical protein
MTGWYLDRGLSFSDCRIEEGPSRNPITKYPRSIDPTMEAYCSNDTWKCPRFCWASATDNEKPARHCQRPLAQTFLVFVGFVALWSLTTDYQEIEVINKWKYQMKWVSEHGEQRRGWISLHEPWFKTKIIGWLSAADKGFRANCVRSDSVNPKCFAFPWHAPLPPPNNINNPNDQQMHIERNYSNTISLSIQMRTAKNLQKILRNYRAEVRSSPRRKIREKAEEQRAPWLLDRPPWRLQHQPWVQFEAFILLSLDLETMIPITDLTHHRASTRSTM